MSGRTRRRLVVADALLVVGAVALFVSLFLSWSHQPSHLQGVPSDPTAWQVYTFADVLLTLLAGGLVALPARRIVALPSGEWIVAPPGRGLMAAAPLGRRRWLRSLIVLACGVALAFVAHAVAVAPSDGALVALPGRGYLPTGATAGPGETLAIVALAIAVGGLTLGRKCV